MRYITKGGVWKNSEDEILKAAVMKYGLNQWSRISSLIVRKSAKQCKARWYEWLDPSIKKTEWDREEEEKLLHLAKIFPCQWRTIAPIVGRTPHQCVAQYEKLLDQAQGKEEMDEDDPRKLKPGEIDPIPETRAPKPDFKDMDEDEKEMLAEARVRLANTQGKKAKRRAREKHIHMAGRLALLQKQRELRAAGIDFLIKKKGKRGHNPSMDYNKEIPFEYIPSNFVYDVSENETPKPDLDLANISLQQLEGERRDTTEDKNQKYDKRKLKKLKEQRLDKVIEKMTKINHSMFKQRTKMVLPEPQLLDQDIEEIGDLNQPKLIQGAEDKATNALIGEYSQRQGTPAPLRTPRYTDKLMSQARDNIALKNVQTPLVGGKNPVLHTGTRHMNSLKPEGSIAATPNILYSKTPSLLQTPRTVKGGQTPMQDDFKINPESLIDKVWESVGEDNQISMVKLEQMKQQQFREDLKTNLESLPAPRNDYQIQIGQTEEVLEEREAKKRLELDQEDIEREKNLIYEKEKQRLFRLRSKSIQKRLPRPKIINKRAFKGFTHIKKMIANEMIGLLQRDALNFPVEGGRIPKINPNLMEYTGEEMVRAAKLIQIEAVKVPQVKLLPSQAFYTKMIEDIVFIPQQKRFLNINSLKKEEQVRFLKQALRNKRKFAYATKERLSGTEQKMNEKNSECQRKLRKIQQQVEFLGNQQENALIKNETYKDLKQKEDLSIFFRQQEISDYHRKLQEKSARLQSRYSSLKRQLDEEE